MLKNKNLLYSVIIIICGIIGLYILNKDKITSYLNELNFLYPNSEVLNLETQKITSENSRKLYRYYSWNEPNIERIKFWSQVCLFYKNEYCVSGSRAYGLRNEDESKRWERYQNAQPEKNVISDKTIVESLNNTNKIDYSFLDNDKSITNDERQCYLIYYKTQDNIELNKKEFIDSYPHCKDYYYKNLPELKNHEQQFLDIFK